MPEIDLRPGFFMFAIVLAALDRSGSVLPILYAMGVHELEHFRAVALTIARLEFET